MLRRLRGLVALFRGPKRAAPRISAHEARRLQESGAAVVDVRTRAEFERGHVPGAIHLPLSEVADRIDEIPRDRPVVVHCALGSRSALAARKLAGLGLENVRDMPGGFREWKNEGLPVEKAAGEQKDGEKERDKEKAA